MSRCPPVFYRCHDVPLCLTGSPDPFDRVAKISSRGFTVLWGKLGVGPKCCEGNVGLLGINVRAQTDGRTDGSCDSDPVNYV